MDDEFDLLPIRRSTLAIANPQIHMHTARALRHALRGSIRSVPIQDRRRAGAVAVLTRESHLARSPREHLRRVVPLQRHLGRLHVRRLLLGVPQTRPRRIHRVVQIGPARVAPARELDVDLVVEVRALVREQAQHDVLVEHSRGRARGTLDLPHERPVLEGPIGVNLRREPSSAFLAELEMQFPGRVDPDGGGTVGPPVRSWALRGGRCAAHCPCEARPLYLARHHFHPVDNVDILQV
ncbi:hypothetical protein M758_7G019000 [Ceratodon purpureus]|nr:hypothetical protein M758_7G019000 [Ceratodon purpureus]